MQKEWSVIERHVNKQTWLLVRRHSFIGMSLGPAVRDGARRPNVQSNALASERLDKYLHIAVRDRPQRQQ